MALGDLEPDEELKAGKEELMKQLTVAYENNDHHALLRLELEWLQKEIHGGEVVLDVGTGSAILAMAAIKLGAASAIGVEHDSVAAECAEEYLALNHVDDRIDIIAGTLDDLPERKQRIADLVLVQDRLE